MAPSLSYQEPPIRTILIQSSFLLSLNLINHLFDRLLNCGLVGQILLGVALGTPGAKWLDETTETVAVQLGYLGLILIVYEGGLSTSLPALRSNLSLSLAVALTGILAPIALSFALLPDLVGATSLQAFAAGAALCSTSLGTTFTVLSSCGLTKTRLGVVLTSAAMMDDVVGLIMVEVIENLGKGAEGEGGGTFDVVTVVRPSCVSLGFAFVAPLVCALLYYLRTVSFVTRLARLVMQWCRTGFSHQQTAFACQTLFLIGIVTAASYAGTSNLFAAYIAGVVITWWDNAFPETDTAHDHATEAEGDHGGSTGISIYQKYYQATLERVFRPLFFASIGFSIPISQMFSGRIVWRGFIYALLMAVGKIVCGVWLLRIPLCSTISSSFRRFLDKIGRLPRKVRLGFIVTSYPDIGYAKKPEPKVEGSSNDNDVALRDLQKTAKRSNQDHHQPEITYQQEPSVAEQATERLGSLSNRRTDDALSFGNPEPEQEQSPPSISPSSPRPLSLYPSLLLGTAMIPRGEIGFLISSIADSNGSLGGDDSSPHSPSNVFLAATWAILLCTICGPVGVGWLVRRVKGLEGQGNRQEERTRAGLNERVSAGEYTAGRAAAMESGRRRDEVLGVWGVG